MPLPTALLHDHLDGGLRIETMLELADASGYAELPAKTADGLTEWFRARPTGTLEDYLEAFVHTVAVMQTAEAIERIAYEAVVDLAADGVRYAELRYAPSHSMRAGLSREDALEAMVAGLRRGTSETDTQAWAIAVALRHQTDSLEVAQAAARFSETGVVGFDLAGPEDGYPARLHTEGIALARAAGLGVTLHAGEGHGIASIVDALGPGGATRIGHGVRIVDDVTVSDGVVTALGPVARRVRDHQIPLELCITSNVHTGAVPSVDTHPLGMLHRAGFNVTINTDNRLMSGVALSAEVRLARHHLGLGADDIRSMTANALRSGFGDYATRRPLLDAVTTESARPAATRSNG